MKAKPPAAVAAPAFRDPVAFLMSLVNNPDVGMGLRIRAAASAAQYLNTRTRDGGKKDAQQQRAVDESDGEYRNAVAPPLSVVKKRAA
jgi:hypothetical protein